MRRIVRSKILFHLEQPRISRNSIAPYICSICKLQTASFSSAQRIAEQNISFTEKLRKKIWGTDTPPGQADPYGNLSQLDQTSKQEQEQEARLRAERLEKATQISADYEPAVTWDGLEEVGGDDKWYDRAWDARESFAGSFIPREIMTDSDEITATLHRAMVEVFTWKQVGNLLADISKYPPAQDMTMQVHITPCPTGVQLQFPNQATIGDIVHSLVNVDSHKVVVANDRDDNDAIQANARPGTEMPDQKESTESEENVVAEKSEAEPMDSSTPNTYEELVASWDPSWRQIAISDPEIKFAITKRMMQLSGIRIPDAALISIQTPGALLSHIIRPPKPCKLVDALAAKEELLQLPNVTIYPRKLTSINKEKAVGRWKVIEEELIARGLPVTGHR